MSEEQVIEIRRNQHVLHCPHCNCKILKPSMGVLNTETHALPIKSLDDTHSKSEWYLVGDMFDFENIGFTKDHTGNNNIKYLTCADCEMEAIGVAYMDQKKFYLAVEMVKHL